MVLTTKQNRSWSILGLVILRGVSVKLWLAQANKLGDFWLCQSPSHFHQASRGFIHRQPAEATIYGQDMWVTSILGKTQADSTNHEVLLAADEGRVNHCWSVAFISAFVCEANIIIITTWPGFFTHPLSNSTCFPSHKSTPSLISVSPLEIRHPKPPCRHHHTSLPRTRDGHPGPYRERLRWNLWRFQVNLWILSFRYSNLIG